MTLPADVFIVAPCEGGVFICTTDKSYFHAGNDIAEFAVFEKLPSGRSERDGVRYLLKFVGWLGEDGFIHWWFRWKHCHAATRQRIHSASR